MKVRINMGKPHTFIIENGKAFSNFLGKVSIGGIIPEALIRIEENHVTSNSIDTSQTLLSMCSCYIGENKSTTVIEVGIPELMTVIKYLDDESPFKLTITDNIVAITKKGKRSALRLIHISPEDIGTALSPEVTEESMELKDRFHFELKGEVLDELQQHLALTNCSVIIFEAINDRLYAMSPETDKVQFKMRLCKTDGDTEVRVAFYATHMNKLLNQIKGAPVSFYIGNDYGEIIVEQEGNIWGICTVTE